MKSVQISFLTGFLSAIAFAAHVGAADAPIYEAEADCFSQLKEVSYLRGMTKAGDLNHNLVRSGYSLLGDDQLKDKILALQTSGPEGAEVDLIIYSAEGSWSYRVRQEGSVPVYVQIDGKPEKLYFTAAKVGYLDGTEQKQKIIGTLDREVPQGSRVLPEAMPNLKTTAEEVKKLLFTELQTLIANAIPSFAEEMNLKSTAFEKILSLNFGNRKISNGGLPLLYTKEDVFFALLNCSAPEIKDESIRNLAEKALNDLGPLPPRPPSRAVTDGPPIFEVRY